MPSAPQKSRIFQVAERSFSARRPAVRKAARLFLLCASFALESCGGGGSGTTTIASSAGQPVSVNQVIAFKSGSDESVVEANIAAYQAFAKSTASSTITYSIKDGADAALFSLSDSGLLTFRTRPRYAAPADANRDNVYEVRVAASDGSNEAIQAVRLTVTPVAASCVS